MSAIRTDDTQEKFLEIVSDKLPRGRFYASNWGKVYDKEKNEIIGQTLGDRYYIVKLCGIEFHVHRLVAIAWLPKPKEGYNVVSFLDGNSFNCNRRNLFWTTKANVLKRTHEERARVKESRRVLGTPIVREIKGVERD